VETPSYKHLMNLQAIKTVLQEHQNVDDSYMEKLALEGKTEENV